MVVAHLSHSQKYSMGQALLRIVVTVRFPAKTFLLLRSAKSMQYSLPFPRYRKVAEQHEFRHFDTMGYLAKFVQSFSSVPSATHLRLHHGHVSCHIFLASYFCATRLALTLTLVV